MFFQLFAPQKDERGGVKLDINNLLPIRALSWTLDRDPRGENSPQVFHHSAQRRLVNVGIISKDKRKGPFHRGSYLANRVIGFFLGGTVGKKVRGICFGTTAFGPTL